MLLKKKKSIKKRLRPRARVCGGFLRGISAVFRAIFRRYKRRRRRGDGNKSDRRISIRCRTTNSAAKRADRKFVSARLVRTVSAARKSDVRRRQRKLHGDFRRLNHLRLQPPHKKIYAIQSRRRFRSENHADSLR